MPLQTDAQKQVASSHTNVLDALLALSFLRNKPTCISTQFGQLLI
jgi:hypothetical protein